MFELLLPKEVCCMQYQTNRKEDKNSRIEDLKISNDLLEKKNWKKEIELHVNKREAEINDIEIKF